MNDELSDEFQYVYERAPIHYWEGCCTLRQYLTEYFNHFPYKEEDHMELLEHIIRGINRIARQTSWEGDGLWRILPVPYLDNRYCSWPLALVIRQSNNGTVFIASQVPLEGPDKD